MSAQPNSAQANQPQHKILSIIQLWSLLLLTLHLAAYQLPEESSWSLWPYTLLPQWLGWALALLAAGLIIPGIVQTTVKWLHEFWLVLPGKQYPRRWFAGIALASGLLFWLARIRHLVWGDSYLLSIALSYHDLDLRVIYNWQAPFTVFLHQRLWQFVADPLLGWPVENVYATLSILTGMIFVYILLSFTARLGRDLLERVILAGLILTTGSIQLFFGYVENYTIISLGLLITTFLAWRTLQRELPPLWPVIALSLTNAFHPSTVFIWPAMWWLVWRCWQRGDISWLKATLQLGLPPLLVGAAVLGLMESGAHGLDAFLGVDRPGGGDGIWFVPLFELSTEWQHYTMFSTAHFLDWANLHLLISPFGIPLLFFTLMAIRRFQLTLFTAPADKDFAIFLGIASMMYILFTWLWNADYGMRKDWDLFAPSAFVYTFLAGILLVRLFSERERLRQGSLFVIGVAFIHTAAWVFANTHNLPRE